VADSGGGATDAPGAPGTDGKADSISLALGFTCANAIFAEAIVP
jgi:hypothetical protein